MPSSTDLSGWAGDIIESMELSGVTTGSVVSWLENNVGNLNLSLHTTGFYLLSGDILPEMTVNEMAIYTQMYNCYYLAKESRRAAQLGYDDWVEVNGQDQGSIRKVSKSELSKNFHSLAKDCNSKLEDLLDWYLNQGGNGEDPARMPLQVIGDQAYKCSIPTEYLTSSNCFCNE
jgi:hypothetical protein